MYVFLKAPLLLEDIHSALVSLSFAHEKIHHCVYKCQIAMQIGICVPNYPFCVFAKRMCRQILQVWVGRLLEIWLPLSQHQIRWCVLTVSGRRKHIWGTALECGNRCGQQSGYPHRGRLKTTEIYTKQELGFYSWWVMHHRSTTGFPGVTPNSSLLTQKRVYSDVLRV